MRAVVLLIGLLFSTDALAQSCGLGDFGTGPYMQHGESRTFYSYGTALPPKTCADLAQVRTCKYGLLSGSSDYKVEKCYVAVQAEGASWQRVMHDVRQLLSTNTPDLPYHKITIVLAVLFAFLAGALWVRFYTQRTTTRDAPQRPKTPPPAREAAPEAPKPTKPPEPAPEPPQDDIRERIRRSMFGEQEKPAAHAERPQSTASRRESRGKVVSSNTYEF